MKILQISASYKPAFIYGGPTMSVSELSEQLVTAGYNISLYTTTANGAAELDVIPNKTTNVDGVSVTYFRRITKDHTHFSPALLKAVWKTSKDHDVVHIHAWWNLVSVLSCLIAVFRGTPVVVSARGTLSPYSFQNKNRGIKRFIHEFISKPVLKKCHLHVTSKRENEAVQKIIKPRSITRISNFVKLPASISPCKNISSTGLRLLFLSRIEEKKGLDILISALSMLHIPYSITIAGPGDENYVNTLKALAVTKGVDKQITWAGFAGKDKFELLQQHDLFVLPSHDENFGNVVIESLATGTAVLISEQVGLAAYVAENKLGWICNTSPQSVAENILKIAGNKQELSRIRQQAPDLIYQDFENNKLVSKYIDLYSSTISSH